MNRTVAVHVARRSYQRFVWFFVMALTVHLPLSAHRYTEPQASGLRETYTWIKMRAEESFRREYPNLQLPSNESVDFSMLQLQWLDSDSAISNHGHTKQQLFVALAFQVVSVREVLTRAGYPAAIWATRLATFEKKFVAAISRLPLAEDVISRCVLAAIPGGKRLFDSLIRESWSDPMDIDPGSRREMAMAMLACEEDSPIIEEMDGEVTALVTRMSAYRSRNRSRVPPIELNKGIGGTSPAAVQIVWHPEQGQLRVITKFDHDLCTWLKLNADDPRQCTQWRDVLGDELGPASEYRYFARWPNGRTRTGQISVTFSDDKKRWTLSEP